MLKKMLAAALCLCALLCPPAASLAGDGAYVLAKPDRGNTISMRAKPKGKGLLIGRFYPGANVVRAGIEKQGWIEVTIGDSDANLTGYIPSRGTLQDPASAEDGLFKSMPLYTSVFSSWPLYAEPSNESEVLATFGYDEVVQLMGVCRSWWLVRCNGKTGFVPAGSESVLEETLAVVRAGVPEGTLPLRAEPDADAASLGAYHSGILVRVLPEKSGEWTRVNVRGMVGYLPTDHLAIGVRPDADTPAPPTLKVPANCPLWDRPDSASLQHAGPARESVATVIGELEGWYHVRLGNAYGFIEAAAAAR